MPPGVRLEKTGHHSFFGRRSLRRGGERAKTEEPAARVREARLVDGPPRRRLEELEARARAGAKGDRTKGSHPAVGEEGGEAEAEECHSLMRSPLLSVLLRYPGRTWAHVLWPGVSVKLPLAHDSHVSAPKENVPGSQATSPMRRPSLVATVL